MAIAHPAAVAPRVIEARTHRAPSVAMTDPTVAPIPRCASGISAPATAKIWNSEDATPALAGPSPRRSARSRISPFLPMP